MGHQNLDCCASETHDSQEGHRHIRTGSDQIFEVVLLAIIIIFNVQYFVKHLTRAR